MRQTPQRCFVFLLAAAIVVGAPAQSQAGLLDIIWDMSGPQMYGGVMQCRLPLNGSPARCRIVGFPFDGKYDVMTGHRLWLNLGGGVYTSGGKDENGVPYEWFRTNMLAFEPMVEVASDKEGTWRFHHGVGGTFQFLYGPDFRRFANAGFKLRPLGVEIGNHWEMAFNLRFFPDGYGADQFGFGPRPSGDRGFEYQWGFVIGPKFGKDPKLP